jgi:hypothetical protein
MLEQIFQFYNSWPDTQYSRARRRIRRHRALPVLIEAFRFDQNGKKGSKTQDLERFLIAKVEQLWREAL